MWVTDPLFRNPPHNGDHCLIRHADGLHYEWLRVYDYQHPIPSGSEFKGVRTTCVSPFVEDNGLAYYFGGYDTGNGPVTNTAWICRATYPPRVAGPSVVTPRMTGQDQFGLQITGEAGATYRIEVSGDLLHWQTAAVTNAPGSVWEWIEPIPPGVSKRFYRVQALEP
jgi:hypothetical protein